MVTTVQIIITHSGIFVGSFSLPRINEPASSDTVPGSATKTWPWSGIRLGWLRNCIVEYSPFARWQPPIHTVLDAPPPTFCALDVLIVAAYRKSAIIICVLAIKVSRQTLKRICREMGSVVVFGLSYAKGFTPPEKRSSRWPDESRRWQPGLGWHCSVAGNSLWYRP